ncbi:hypothetical protein GCM10022393_04040 [Aquimarina addita]|uniref:SecDF P1 head subdomain domain-containing protein n=2 Tax=Aquimarina addita TaxID=870485 RepID=A0ABP7X9H3_9FLAO
MVSCSVFGPQPDKIIEVVVEVDEQNVSEKEMQLIQKKIVDRLSKVSRTPEVARINNSNQISIKVPTHHSIERIKQYITNPGKLDFYELYPTNQFTDFFVKANEIARLKKDEENPLFSLLVEPEYSGNAVLFSVAEQDTAKVRRYISSEAVVSSLPVDTRLLRFLWGKKERESEVFPLYALQLGKEGKPGLSGNHVEGASHTFDPMGNPVIAVKMDEKGAKVWEKLTGKAFQNQTNIAIILNDEVYSAPRVLSGPILEGRSEISGNFTVEEAQDLANIITSGAIPSMRLISFDVQKLQ